MTQANHSSMEKIVNPDLALAVFHNAQPHGEFRALVKLAEHTPLPASMTSVEIYAPGLFRARIPCRRIEDVAADSNVISIELQERVA